MTIQIIPVRVCTCCKKETPATTDFFHVAKLGRHGLKSVCKSCCRARDLADKEKIRPYMMAYRDANKEKAREYGKKYRTENWQDLLGKKNKYKANNVWVKLRARMGNRLRFTLKNGKFGKCSEDVLGYTFNDLKSHIEKQFSTGMTWERFMRGEIHIDHIIPVSSFKADTVESEEFKACWALSNLRPMWAKDNLSKGAKLLNLI